MTPYQANQMIDAVAATALAPGALKVPRGWDATDPDGCWMHDLHKVPDYCHGFRLFDVYEEALAYAVSMDNPSLLGFDTEAQRWAVEPMEGDYGY